MTVRRWLLLYALLPAACVSVPPPAADPDAAAPPDGATTRDADVDAAAGCIDGDGDGYYAAGCAAVTVHDCDDSVGEVHPGAVEQCATTRDEDCLPGPLDCAEALVPVTVSYPTTDTIVVGSSQGILELAAGSNWMPRSLVSLTGSSAELLYSGTSNERLAGISYWNAYFSWEAPTPAGRTVKVEGPAAFRVQVDWNAIASNMTGMHGTSIVTIYPDGRVHRDEDFTVDIGEAGQWLTAYVSLLPERFTHVRAGSQTREVVDDPGGSVSLHSGAGDTLGSMCAYHDTAGDRVGWAWRVPGGGAGSRATNFDFGDDSHHVALQYDWDRGPDLTPAGGYAGNFLMLIGATPASGEPCDGIADTASSLLAPPAISVEAPASLTIGGGGDEDDDGYNEGGGFYQIDAAGAAQVAFVVDTTGASSPPTIAVRLTGFDETHAPLVAVDEQRLVHGRDYLLGDGWLFVSQRLPDGARVTITRPEIP